jgi:hypothetical protein
MFKKITRGSIYSKIVFNSFKALMQPTWQPTDPDGLEGTGQYPLFPTAKPIQ